MKRIFYFFIFALIVPLHLLGDEETTKKLTYGGFVYYQFGQIVKSEDPTGAIGGSQQYDKGWDQHVNFRLTLDAAPSPSVRIIGGGEFGIATFANGHANGTSVLTAFSLKEAQGIYTVGDYKMPLFQAALGYFPYKYNAPANNFGEYFFSYRANAYSPYIINDFDNCKARLLGLRLSSSVAIPSQSFKFDGLLTSELPVASGVETFKSVGDYTLSFLVDDKLFKCIDIGAGISWYKLLSLDQTQTNPYDATQVVDKNDSLVLLSNGDTLRLTQQSTKLMLHVSIDLKKFLPDGFASLLSKDDGILYTEEAILGLKNYGKYYDDILKRIPVMVGFNVPCFNAVDFLSVEMEYFGWNGSLLIIPGNPTPTFTDDGYLSQQMFRWSLFSQKTIAKGFAVKGIIGKDHFRTIDAGGSVTKSESLRGNDNWHYVVRFMYSF
jgi:hypothetical protein